MKGHKVMASCEAIKSLFWILLIGSFVWSVAQNRLVNSQRTKIIGEIEQQRGSKVITMIHRQETVGFLGLPIKKYIQMEDAEAVVRAIREIPNNQPIDMIIHTPGGVLLPAYQIAKALKDHKGKVTVFVPHYAMSGGTLIALAADEIVMDKNAVLGPIDPQLGTAKGTVPAVSVLKIPEYKAWQDVDDMTVIIYDQAQKILKQITQYVNYLISDKSQKTAHMIINRLVLGQVTHDYPVFCSEAMKLGLRVSDKMPELIYKLMDLYPQPKNVANF